MSDENGLNDDLAASSKLACAEWVREDVHVSGLDETSDDACYRVTDRLPEIEPVLAEQAYHQVTDLLNLEVDLLFLDYPANKARDLALAAYLLTSAHGASVWFMRWLSRSRSRWWRAASSPQPRAAASARSFTVSARSAARTGRNAASVRKLGQCSQMLA